MVYNWPPIKGQTVYRPPIFPQRHQKLPPKSCPACPASSTLGVRATGVQPEGSKVRHIVTCTQHGHLTLAYLHRIFVICRILISKEIHLSLGMQITFHLYMNYTRYLVLLLTYFALCLDFRIIRLSLCYC